MTKEAIRTALANAKTAGKLAMDANIEEILPLIETIASMANGNGNGNGGEMSPDPAPMATEPSSAICAIPLEQDNWGPRRGPRRRRRRGLGVLCAPRRSPSPLPRRETEEEKESARARTVADARSGLATKLWRSGQREAKDKKARDSQRGVIPRPRTRS